MDISPSQIITDLLNVENGILAGGWVLAIYLLWKFLSNKDEKTTAISALLEKHTEDKQTMREAHEEKMTSLRDIYENQLNELRKLHDQRVDEAETEFNERLKEASDRLYELNQTHVKMITDLSEKRIEDLKVMSEDYNKMAESVRTALEKLAQHLTRKAKG